MLPSRRCAERSSGFATTNAEKVETYRRALDAGASWLPSRAEDDLMLVLEFLDANGREQEALSAWAGFAYVGA